MSFSDVHSDSEALRGKMSQIHRVERKYGVRTDVGGVGAREVASLRTAHLASNSRFQNKIRGSIA